MLLIRHLLGYEVYRRSYIYSCRVDNHFIFSSLLDNPSKNYLNYLNILQIIVKVELFICSFEFCKISTIFELTIEL